VMLTKGTHCEGFLAHAQIETVGKDAKASKQTRNKKREHGRGTLLKAREGERLSTNGGANSKKP